MIRASSFKSGMEDFVGRVGLSSTSSDMQREHARARVNARNGASAEQRPIEQRLASHRRRCRLDRASRVLSSFARATRCLQAVVKSPATYLPARLPASLADRCSKAEGDRCSFATPLRPCSSPALRKKTFAFTKVHAATCPLRSLAAHGVYER